MKQSFLVSAFMAALLLVCGLLPWSASAAELPFTPGHQHVDVDIYDTGEEDLQAQEAQPSAYDPRFSTWFNNSIFVKDQGWSNICWACSAATVAEINYAMRHGQIDPLSPPQIAYFLYNRKNDPMGKTERDVNVPHHDWNLDGGACVNTFQHLATWSGLVSNSLMSLEDLAAYYDGNDQRPAPTGYSNSLAYNNNSVVLKNCDYLPSVKYNETGRNTVKSMIRQYGGVVVSLQVDADKQTDGTQPYYFRYGDMDSPMFYKPDRYEANDHEVAIIGWDDNFDRNEFASWDPYTGDYTLTPERDGAWIVQNSWGDVSGDNGYYYVSYESQDILADGILGMEMEAADSGMLNFQYDGSDMADNVEMFSNESAANVYSVPEGKQIILDEVGFTTWNNGKTNYKIEIYTSLTDKTNPRSGIKAATASVTTTTPGYKTFSVPAVSLVGGQRFAIVVNYSSKTLAGTESAVKKSGSFNFNGWRYKVGVSKGQSFYYEKSIGKWKDASRDEVPFCFRIKGLADTRATACIHSYETVKTVKAKKGVKGYTVKKCIRCGNMKMANIKKALAPKPYRPSNVRLTKSKRAFTVKWKKSTEKIAGEYINGYQIRYSLKKSMKGAKKVAVNSRTKTSHKVKHLKSKKKYYVQVRAYYFDHNNKVWYSKWSKKKSITVR